MSGITPKDAVDTFGVESSISREEVIERVPRSSPRWIVEVRFLDTD